MRVDATTITGVLLVSAFMEVSSAFSPSSDHVRLSSSLSHWTHQQQERCNGRQQQRARTRFIPMLFQQSSGTSWMSRKTNGDHVEENELNLDPSSSSTRLQTFFCSLILSVAVSFSLSQPSSAVPPPSTTTTSSTLLTAASTTTTDTRQDLETARNTLNILLNNWEKAVIDCTYADVPRELLEQRNKDLLLEKASTFALFDKSVSVTSCKTNNRLVRDYLGATGKGPVVGLEKKLRQGLELVLDKDNDSDDDILETYLQTVEQTEQALAKAKSLAYAAGVADFNAVNNFAEAETALVLSGGNDSNLEQARQSIVVVVQGLDQVLKLIS